MADVNLIDYFLDQFSLETLVELMAISTGLLLKTSDMYYCIMISSSKVKLILSGMFDLGVECYFEAVFESGIS